MVEILNTDRVFFTNTYLISNGNKCVIVDPGLNFSKAAEKIKSKYEVEAILITHGHLDHIDGIQYFECPIYISTLDYSNLFDDKLSLYEMMGKQNPLKNCKLNVKKIKNGDIINLICYNFMVIHTPGHTKGSVCYKYEEGLISGDTLFQGSYGRTDFPTGSYEDIVCSIRKLAGMIPDDMVIYPGHGTTTSMSIEKKYNPCLRK